VRYLKLVIKVRAFARCEQLAATRIETSVKVQAVLFKKRHSWHL